MRPALPPSPSARQVLARRDDADHAAAVDVAELRAQQREAALGARAGHLYIGRGLYSMSLRMFVDALVQYQAETKRVLTTARFNFTYRPLSDFAIALTRTA